MKVILAHSGKQHSYYVARALNDLGHLERFYTSSYIRNKTLQKYIEIAGINYLKRRYLPGLSGGKICSSWMYEAKEMMLRLSGTSGAEVNNAVFIRDHRFDTSLSNRLDKIDYDVFWGFQGSCLESLRRTNELGRESVCEMTIAHLPYAKMVLEEESRLQPEWAESIDFANFPAYYEKRLIGEPETARTVIAISEFLKNSLTWSGIDHKKIKVIPLGFDPVAVRFNSGEVSITNRPLRVLYAGRITQRKGISYLLEAMKGISSKDIELHIIGNIHGSGEMFMKHKKLFNYRPGITQHSLYQMYTEYDALVFPSLLEGFGLVTIEAMGAGLPVITTPNTNAFELIQDNKNGYLVAIRDSNAIRQALLKLRDLSDDDFQSMRFAARQTALKYSWDNHKKNVGNFLAGLNPITA